MKRYETPSVEVTKFEVEEIMLSTTPVEPEDPGFGDIL